MIIKFHSLTFNDFLFKVSLVGTDLVIVNVSQSDAGTYTCELDTDDITPLAVSHVLQILGKIIDENTKRPLQNNFAPYFGGIQFCIH